MDISCILTWLTLTVTVAIPTSEDQYKCQVPFLLNGEVKYHINTTFLPNDYIEVVCSDGFATQVSDQVLQKFKLYCKESLIWVTKNNIAAPPLCTVRVCHNPPDIPHTSMEINDLYSRTSYPSEAIYDAVYGRRVFLDGQTVVYRCHSGYELVMAASTQLTCAAGEWRGNLVTCISVKHCETPDPVLHGSYSLPTLWNGVLEIGSRVSYTCDAGYKMVGSRTLLCVEGATWSHNPPECIPSDETSQYCPSVSSIMNGECFCDSKNDLQYCEPFFFGLHVECVCNHGYKLYGESIITCLKDGTWDYIMPTCVQEMEIDDSISPSSGSQAHMSTLAIVVATACSVLGILLLIMIIMVCRRRKPHPPRLCRPSTTPPPYSRVHNHLLEEHDRMLLIGYENNPSILPSYEEAIRGQNQQLHSHFHGARPGQVGEYRPLPSIPSNLRNPSGSSDIASNRHSIVTTSTMNRDGLSEVFGSIDTVNVSMSDASTAVTVDTLDSASSHHSSISRRANAGSINSSNNSLAAEDAPLLESNQRDDSISTQTAGENLQDKSDD